MQNRLVSAGLLGLRERSVQVSGQQPQRVRCITRLSHKTLGRTLTSEYGSDAPVGRPPLIYGSDALVAVGGRSGGHATRRHEPATSTPPANRIRRSAAERPDAPAATAAQAGVSSPSWYQFLTIAGALAVVSSVLVGGIPGLAVQAGTGRLAASRRRRRGYHRHRCAGRTPRAAASDLARGSQRQHHRQR
jgi:hypothetical protein